MEKFFLEEGQKDKFKENAKNILSKPTPKEAIKQRDNGNGVILDYVEGAYVIRVLNKAFDYMWDWEIVDFRIIESQPKQVKKYYDKKQNRWVNLDEPILEPQPPVAHVLGKLTVPGFGTRYGFGSKVIIGGASEQESIFKAAATDALKVAAKHFGIALDLYEENPVVFEDDASALANNSRGNLDYTQYQKQQDPVKEEEDDFTKLRQLAAKLGITSSSGLNPYIKDFSDGAIEKYEDLPPEKLPLFIIYLAKKVEELGK